MGRPDLAHPEIPGLEETNQKITNLKESNGIMCGIVGYIGQNDAYPVLIEGLKKLEYRGYDSAGVALINSQNQLNIYKTKGKVSNLEAMAAEKDCSGHVGIAHTRWATHGEPSATNAHPHVSMSSVSGRWSDC